MYHVPGPSSRAHTPLSTHKVSEVVNAPSSSKSSQVHNSFSVLSDSSEEPLNDEEVDLSLNNDKENMPPKRPRKHSQKMTEVLESAVGGQAKANKPVNRANGHSGSRRK